MNIHALMLNYIHAIDACYQLHARGREVLCMRLQCVLVLNIYQQLQHPNLRLQFVVFGLEQYSTNLN